MNDRKSVTLWVCADCLMSEATGSVSDDPDYVPNREPWGLIADSDEITAGLVREEHDCGYEDHDEAWPDYCECEQREFSWSACDACGSTLGGSRDAYTLWYNDEENDNAR